MTGDPALPEDKWLAQRLDEMQREIDELRGARQMMATVLKGGSWSLVSDATDATVMYFARSVDKEGNDVYGIQVLDTISDDGDQATVLAVFDDARGIVYPFEHHQWIVPTPQSISSGTFVGIAECVCVWPNADTLQASGAIITPVGTTAEVRLSTGFGETTNVVTIPSGSSVTVEFDWIHPWSVGWGDATHPRNTPFIHWDVRLASGAGPVTAYPPRHLTFRDRRFFSAASTTGGGRVV